MSILARRKRLPSREINGLSELVPGFDVTVKYNDGGLCVGPVIDVINRSDNWAVYIDDVQRIRYSVSSLHEFEDYAEFVRQWNRVARLQFIVDQLQQTLPDDPLDRLQHIIGHAVGAGLECDNQGMSGGLDNVENLLDGMIRRSAKQIYVRAAVWSWIMCAMVAIALSLIGYVYFPHFDSSWSSWCGGVTAWLDVVIVGLLGGGTGALFSILTSSKKKIPFDPLSTAGYARFEGRVRSLFGVLSGVIVALCVKVELISSSLTKVHPVEAGMLIVAVVAGFIERLVPNFLANHQSTTDVPPDASAATRKDGATESLQNSGGRPLPQVERIGGGESVGGAPGTATQVAAVGGPLPNAESVPEPRPGSEATASDADLVPESSRDRKPPG